MRDIWDHIPRWAANTILVLLLILLTAVSAVVGMLFSAGVVWVCTNAPSAVIATGSFVGALGFWVALFIPYQVK